MAAKHFMIYCHKEPGTYVVTEPRPWASENRHHFLNYNFQPNNHPTTDVVEVWLIENRNFQRVVDTDDISLIQNVDPEIDL